MSAPTVKTWQERMGPGYVDGGADLPEEVAMKAEIADLRARIAELKAAFQVPGLGRITDEDDGFLTLQFKDEDSAQAFMAAYHPTVDVRDMPPSAQPTGQAATTASAQPELAVWYGPMPESNGKSNFTAILMRKGAKLFDGMEDGITIDRSEYPDRVRYEADRVRYLIGELAERPELWDKDYDFDKHSGYVAPERVPVTTASPSGDVERALDEAHAIAFYHGDGTPDGHAIAAKIEELKSQFATEPSREAAPLDDLWIHEDMDRDATAAVVSLPRKELVRHYEQARGDVAHWRRRALTAEAAQAAHAGAPLDETPEDCIAGSITDKQLNEVRGLYSSIHHTGIDAADTVIRKAALYGYMNGRRDFGQAAHAGAEEDTARLDWLEARQVDTIYFDDHTIMDVGGSKRPHDIRAAIDLARAAPATNKGKPA
jgi:hypothetical protein